MSSSFATVDLDHLQFPAKMYIDYVRVYQRDDVDPKDGVGCSPSHHPTEDYINKYVPHIRFLAWRLGLTCCSFLSHAEAYTNANWTTWDDAGFTIPRNSEYDGC